MKSKKTSRSERISSFLLVVFSGILVVSLVVLGRYFWASHKNSEQYENLRSAVKQTPSSAVADAGSESDSSSAASSDSEPAAPVIDFDALHEINPDIIGWIYIEGTKIDYPILQTDDNDFYLHHDYMGKSSANGSIFADFRNEAPFSDRNTVLYGHNMKNGQMFHDLLAYQQQSFFDEHPVAHIYTPEGEYQIAFLCGTTENGAQEFVSFDFTTDEDFVDYVNAFRRRSTFQSDVVLEDDDRIVTLSTCSYVRDNARFALIGRIVPQD